MVEGVNGKGANLASLHTVDGCEISPNTSSWQQGYVTVLTPGTRKKPTAPISLAARLALTTLHRSGLASTESACSQLTQWRWLLCYGTRYDRGWPRCTYHTNLPRSASGSGPRASTHRPSPWKWCQPPSRPRVSLTWRMPCSAGADHRPFLVPTRATARAAL